MKSSIHRLFLPAALLSGVVLGGCATFSKDGGFGTVADTARTSLGKDVRWTRTPDERAKSNAQVTALLANPLSADDAVQVALLSNPGLQASFEALGISEADLVQSGRLPNPRFTLRHAGAAGLYDIEETLSFNVLSIITAPAVHAAEKRRFAQVQSAIIAEVAQLAYRARTAYYTAVAAQDSLHYAWQVKDAAQTSAELAHRMLGAGNWNRLDQARQQLFYARAMQYLARAQLADETARVELRHQLGIADEGTVLRLADHLPELPQNIVQLPNLEQTALANRADLQMMRSELDELARRLKLTKTTRFVNVLDVGPTRVREGTREDPYEKGYEVSLEVPIFDTGGARVRKSEAVYAQALDRFAQAALDARADVHDAAAHYRIAYEMAVREQDDIASLHKSIVRQDVLRYNAALVSVFDLLADAQQQISSVDDYIQSVRDFWIARARLDISLIADLPR